MRRCVVPSLFLDILLLGKHLMQCAQFHLILRDKSRFVPTGRELYPESEKLSLKSSSERVSGRIGSAFHIILHAFSNYSRAVIL